jgi:hypothetical protein
MTLCIAAACQHQGNPAVAFCSDTKSVSGQGWWGQTISSENADKSRYVENFSAYVANDPTKADELLAFFLGPVRRFSAQAPGPDSDLYITEFFEGLRAAARLRMGQIKDHHVTMRTPFADMDDFLARAKDSLPSLQYGEVWNEVRALDLGCEVLLGGFHEEAIIVKVGANGEVHWIDQYDAIGSGSSDALAFLAQNDYDETEIESHDALMRLGEALEFSSRMNSTVSYTRRYELLVMDKGSHDVTEKFHDLIRSRYRLARPVKLDPKKLGEFLESDEDSSKTPELK